MGECSQQETCSAPLLEMAGHNSLCSSASFICKSKPVQRLLLNSWFPLTLAFSFPHYANSLVRSLLNHRKHLNYIINQNANICELPQGQDWAAQFWARWELCDTLVFSQGLKVEGTAVTLPIPPRTWQPPTAAPGDGLWKTQFSTNFFVLA